MCGVTHQVLNFNVCTINISSLRQATLTPEYYSSLWLSLPWNLNRIVMRAMFHIQIIKEEGIIVISCNNFRYSLGKPYNLMPISTTRVFFSQPLYFQTSKFPTSTINFSIAHLSLDSNLTFLIDHIYLTFG